MQPFTIKYQPKKTSEIIGQDTAIKNLKNFVVNFKRQKKNAALLYGPSGVGKTISVHALANELDLEILEVNASDVRNAEQINSLVGSAVGQMSLFSKGKIILVDEIDGLSGMKDRGGLLAITKLIEKSSFPLILTITNPWDYKFNKLRRKTEMIEFAPLDYLDIFKILKKICEQEKIKYEHQKTIETKIKSDAFILDRTSNEIIDIKNKIKQLEIKTQTFSKSQEEFIQIKKEFQNINEIVRIKEITLATKNKELEILKV
ncbi:MAG: AAA family ATPase, partial [Nanoarchaeota archaeon]|nr:AAA family ATPase [Nanoarchaeota archaeon]